MCLLSLPNGQGANSKEASQVRGKVRGREVTEARQLAIGRARARTQV